MEVAVKVLLSYLLGSIMGGLVLGYLRGVDIRQTGSGNAGATNALRTQGKGFALGVLLIDIGKGILAALLIPVLPWPGSSGVPHYLPMLCAVAAVIGHIYPVFFGFRGGKGAATLAGAAFTVVPGVIPIVLGVWLLGIMFSGYVGISTILAAAAAPVYISLTRDGGLFTPEGLFTLTMALLILYTHRSNLTRMLRGEEHRFESAMLWRKLIRR